MNHSARTVPLREGLPIREDEVGRVVLVFRLLFRVEVVEVAEELVEAVSRRKVLVTVAQVVLAELPCGVPLLLQQARDRRVFDLHPLSRPEAQPSTSPERKTLWPMMNDERPAVQDCSP